ncbi:hypothetical protein AA15237_0839 [Komagataeibacter xylinus NBRC 15237]|nr:hypothetical protein AA15237_0839 [Komagataeibacter xylinus NBRC 15237]
MQPITLRYAIGLVAHRAGIGINENAGHGMPPALWRAEGRMERAGLCGKVRGMTFFLFRRAGRWQGYVLTRS